MAPKDGVEQNFDLDEANTSEVTIALDRIASEYERRLKMFGVELCDLPAELVAKLKEYIWAKDVTKLKDLSLPFLEESHYERSMEEIADYAGFIELENEVRELEEELRSEQAQSDQLEKFIDSTNGRIITDQLIASSRYALNKALNRFKDIRDSYDIPNHAIVDDLLEKFKLLSHGSDKSEE